ncbi:MAG TPA: hypothetical protein VEZ90_08815 [Blastocatellia bacterium]|nr:hypothetical protein [Blastocatellia bacterium]
MASRSLLSRVLSGVTVAVVIAAGAFTRSISAASLQQGQAEKAPASQAQNEKQSGTSAPAPSKDQPSPNQDKGAAAQATPTQQPQEQQQSQPPAETSTPAAGKRRVHGKVLVPRPKTPVQSGVNEKLTKARTDLMSATQAYKTSLSNLLPYQESALKAASDQVQLRQSLFEKGIVSKRELEDSKHSLAEAQSKFDETKRQLSEADSMLAEVEDDQYLKVPSAPGEYRSIGAVIRYTGSTQWSLKDASKVESFYESQFGQQLPISAFGQTAVHDRLGFDHHDAMDVAIQPDSPRGEALMEYLRKAGIPFIAFRHAVPGSATGAHIHIGKPSHRIAPRESTAGGR